MPEQTRIEIAPSEHVSALIYPAARERAGIALILAPGAGASQASRFMVRFATGLAARGIDTVTFNFAYLEQGRRVPDQNRKLETCYRKVVQAVHDGLLIKNSSREKLAIGGKSMGGRIASQVVAAGADGVAGLVLLGYPLHPPGHPEKPRSKHLPQIRVPTLIVQGSRDVFGNPDELRPVISTLAAPVELHVVDGGDHSFAVSRKAVPPQEQVYDSILDTIAHWLREKLAQTVVPAHSPRRRA
jgi:predicted alpha/beta-hydrolase family hydrolase